MEMVSVGYHRNRIAPQGSSRGLGHCTSASRRYQETTVLLECRECLPLLERLEITLVRDLDVNGG